MSDSELVQLGIIEAAEKIRSKEVSPVDLVGALLKRIADMDPKINSFITVTADQAQKEARQAELELMQGEKRSGLPLGQLHGVPIGLKDLFETKGVRTTAGSIYFGDNIPAEDALVVRKLRQAGAILLGKHNMHEIALGLTSVNPHFGAVHNPWDQERIVGGSSGGSAAAIAARFCPAALGSDTGGSIRVPSSLCGTVGLKPTFGRVSLRGVIPLSWNLDHVGPMARRVEDLALLLKVIAGFDLADPNSSDIEVDDYFTNLRDGVRGMKVGLVDDPYFNQADEEILNLVVEAGIVLSDLGADVERVSFPGAFQAAITNGLITTADGAAVHHNRLVSDPDRFGTDVLERLKKGASLRLDRYIHARREQVVLRRKFETFFQEYDCLITPTTPITASLIAGQQAVEMAGLLTRFTAPFNLTGLPAISIPCGFTNQGLPVGMQIITRPWGEAALLRAAYAYELASHWFEKCPIL